MSIMKLPYEIEENIIKYLPYFDVVNYSKINIRAMEVCDVFFRRRAKIENIPIKLLPSSNIASRYLQLYDDKERLFKTKYNTDIKDCFERPILEDDIEEIKWLVGLMKEKEGFDSQKALNISILSIYAFEKDKNIICKWLLSNLLEYNYRSMSEHGTIYNLYVILRFALEKNQTEIIYYILDEFSGIEPKTLLKVFNDLARANDLTNMKKIMTKYNINILYYNDVIVNIIAAVNLIELERKNNYSDKLDTLKFLLQNYPGTNDDLRKILTHYSGFYPKRFTLPILIEYGFDGYIAVLYRMIDIPYDNIENIDNVKWFMLNYGNMIPTESLRQIYDYAYNHGMRKVLYEYISQR